MATATDGSWLPGIGDPTPVGWLTVAAYFGAAWCCWRLVSKAGQQRAPMVESQQRFWWLLTAAMTFLGINKQLDLQTAFTEIGRAFAQAGGWYEQRHQVQVAFIGLVAALGMVGLALLCWVARPLSRDRALALGGLVFLGSFVVIRAASFHHVDLLINDTVFGLRWNGVFELSGIGLVAAGAWHAWRRASSSQRDAVRASFTPYHGPGGHASSAVRRTKAETGPKPDPAPRPAPPQTGTPAPTASADHPPRRKRRDTASGDDGPVRSPGDPRVG